MSWTSETALRCILAVTGPSEGQGIPRVGKERRELAGNGVGGLSMGQGTWKTLGGESGHRPSGQKVGSEERAQGPSLAPALGIQAASIQGCVLSSFPTALAAPPPSL